MTLPRWLAALLLPGQFLPLAAAESEGTVRVTVGRSGADFVGDDNRILQAAVDYVGGLGGGVVEIGPGEFLMRDALHLPSHVTVRGTPGKTILRKAPAAHSPLKIDGDFAEQQITVAEPRGFEPGDGVAVWDSENEAFHVSTARIVRREGGTLFLDARLGSDYLVKNRGEAATVFPLISGCGVKDVRLENLIIEGNKEKNPFLGGCRAGGIYLFDGSKAVIENCVVRNYNGDGISFQLFDDVLVQKCVAEGNAGEGFHPGCGSQRAVIRDSVARANGQDGLFLCWRVRHGRFEENLLENNGKNGISIGHKDTENLLKDNTVRGNRRHGILFRDELAGMGGNNNRLENNRIEDNGAEAGSAGIRVEGVTENLVFKNNLIRDTRKDPGQTAGIWIGKNAGAIALEDNTIEAATPLQDRRKPPQ